MIVLRALVRRSALVATTVLALGFVGTACGGDEEGSAETPAVSERVEPSTTDPEPSPGPAGTSPTTTEADPGPPAATGDAGAQATVVVAPTATTADVTTSSRRTTGTTLVNVYWPGTVQDPAAGSPERIGAGARVVAADAPVRNSLEAMLAGVDAIERRSGMVSSIPEGTRVLGIAVDGTTATVDLSAEFERPGGTLDESMRLAQVVFAVTQFDGIDRVRFHVGGEPRDPILSHGFEIGDGLTRDDFPDVRARIMIEEPHPGAEITNPLVIRGESNTFEANVRYAITGGGGDGIVLADGFTTATAGNGTWGTFEVEVDLAALGVDDLAGPGSIVMWEDDPRSGEQVDVVEIPVVLPDL